MTTDVTRRPQYLSARQWDLCGSDGSSGLERALSNDYDVVVLDRNLPGLHGGEVCVQLIESGRRSRVPMLTVAGDAEDLIEGLFAVTISRLRAKLGKPPLIETVSRSGYRIGR